MPSLSAARRRAPFVAVAFAAWAMTACATTESRGYVAETTLDAPPPRTVALLPVDVHVVFDGMGDLEPEEEAALRKDVNERVARLLAEELPKRGYDLAATLGWEGNGDLDERAIYDMIDGLVAHSNEVAWGGEGGGTIDPEITRYLGAQTGAGAILYVNGRALANTEAKKVWQVVLVGVAALAVVGTVYAASRPSSGGRRGHHAHGGGTVVVGGPVIFVGHHHHHDHVEDDEPGFFDGDAVRLAATLVDASSGEILWHVDLADGLDPRDDEEVAEYLGSIFETLPEPAGGAAPARPAPAPAPKPKPAPGPSPAPAPAPH